MVDKVSAEVICKVHVEFFRDLTMRVSPSRSYQPLPCASQRPVNMYYVSWNFSSSSDLVTKFQHSDTTNYAITEIS